LIWYKKLVKLVTEQVRFGSLVYDECNKLPWLVVNWESVNKFYRELVPLYQEKLSLGIFKPKMKQCLSFKNALCLFCVSLDGQSNHAD